MQQMHSICLSLAAGTSRRSKAMRDMARHFEYGDNARITLSLNHAPDHQRTYTISARWCHKPCSFVHPPSPPKHPGKLGQTPRLIIPWLLILQVRRRGAAIFQRAVDEGGLQAGGAGGEKIAMVGGNEA